MHYIIGCLIAAICFTGCIMEDVEPEVEMVNVSISVSLADVVTSRAYEDAANDYEKMHTLRIVIVRNAKDGVVEQNRLINLQQASTFHGTETFEVRANEQKYIYFFVNEEYTAFDTNAEYGFNFRNDIVVGRSFPYSKLQDARITLGVVNSKVQGMSQYLPMNSLYGLKVESEDMDETFWVVRAATKFTYILNNRNNQPYVLRRLEISHQAATEYYMQRIGDVVPVWSTGNDAIQQQNTSFNTPYEGKTPYHYSFQKDFTGGITVPANGQVQLDPVYLAETKGFSDSSYKNGDENYYTTSLSFDNLESFTGKLKELDCQLPRNTHVVVTVKINQGNATWEVDVFPYTGVNLNPGFGL